MNPSAPESGRPWKISWFRTFIGWTVGVVWTLFMAIAALVLFLVTRSGKIVHGCSKVWSLVLLWLMGIKVKVDGLENVPRDRAILIVSNHQSLCDILVLSGYLPIRFSWIAKKELFRIPFVGAAMAAANYIPIDRQNRERAFQSLEHAAEQLRHFSVVIFPEGTRTRTGKLGNFKKGAIFLLQRAKVPVLPVTIMHSFERLPPERMGVLPGTIFVQIDPIIPTETMTRGELREMFEEIHRRMEQRIEASWQTSAS